MKNIIKFGKLLDRVRYQGSWNKETFMSLASKADVSKSEASRFYEALVLEGFLVKSKDHRKMTPTFDINIWHNEDAKNNIVKRILANNLIFLKRGRVKGKKYSTAITAVVVAEPVNPLAKISSKDLVAELRNRGFVVSCKKEITITEEL